MYTAFIMGLLMEVSESILSCSASATICSRLYASIEKAESNRILWCHLNEQPTTKMQRLTVYSRISDESGCSLSVTFVTVL